MRPSALLPLGLLLAWAAFCLSGWGVQSGGALRQWWQIPLHWLGAVADCGLPPFFCSLSAVVVVLVSLSLPFRGDGSCRPCRGDCGVASFDRAGATAPATGVGCHRRSSWFLSVWVFYFPRSLNARATGFCDPCTF